MLEEEGEGGTRKKKLYSKAQRLKSSKESSENQKRRETHKQPKKTQAKSEISSTLSYFDIFLMTDEKMFYLRANEKGHFDKSGAPLSKQDASFVYLIHRKPVNKPEALAEVILKQSFFLFSSSNLTRTKQNVNVIFLSSLTYQIIAIQSVQTQLFLSRPHFDKKATSTPKFKPHESINASSRKWKIYKNGFKDPAPFYLSANGELCIGFLSFFFFFKYFFSFDDRKFLILLDLQRKRREQL